jgi:predicted membrane protein
MLPYALVLLAILVRFLPFMGPVNFLPHAWHFTPLAASLLYFGARGSRRQIWIPVVLLAATDVVLSKFIYTYPLTWDLLITWAWYAGIVFLGTGLREKSGFWRVVGAALFSSVSFFLISNFGAWAAFAMYPKTFSGLMMSYAAGVPFFRGTVESDLFFSLAFFGLPVMVRLLVDKWNSANDHTAAA